MLVCRQQDGAQAGAHVNCNGIEKLIAYAFDMAPCLYGPGLGGLLVR
jgi:hypothetical protein